MTRVAFVALLGSALSISCVKTAGTQPAQCAPDPNCSPGQGTCYLDETCGRRICLCDPPAESAGETETAPTPEPEDPKAVVAAIEAMLDDWHAAAAAADEERYFGHFTDDGIFLGTDATERWTVEAFRAYAHPHFAKGKAWSFRAVRRDVVLDPGGRLAWFDEDLATPNLGPARGSGVVRLGTDGRWQIAHYNLALTIPNEKMDAVRALLSADPPPP